MSSKGVLGPGAEGPPAHLRTTRSITKAGAQSSVSPQIATQEKKKAKAKEAKEVELKACKLLICEKCLSEDTPITHNTLLRTLSMILQKYTPSTPLPLTRAMMAFAALMNKANNATSQTAPTVEVLTQKLGERVEKAIQVEMDKMSTMIKNSLADQRKASEPSESLTEAVTAIKKVALDMSKTVNEATAAMTQFTDTAQSYKKVLTDTVPQAKQPVLQQTKTQAAMPTEDTQYMISLGIDKKAQQVLLDNTKGEDNCLNIYEIREKVGKAIGEITPPPHKAWNSRR
ncbi:hypothetical protein EI94DRAFT_1705547 [Lactarius quietus]|nr:hypothetical protein EI94DRAFT_1705547 [Lactarius quietus]